VKLDKLVKQLRRDLLGNPKKAAALALMLLVALYFWAPLVTKWFVPAKASAVATTVAGLILEDDPDDGKRPGPRGQIFRWDKIRELISKDERMTSAVLDNTLVDPFRVAEPPPETAAILQPGATEPMPMPVPAPEQPAIDPATAGLTLASVVVGPRRSSAMINGRAYREGQLIRVTTSQHGAAAIEFQLVLIDRLGAELESGGKRWRLSLPRAGLAQGDEITRETQE
jgi:hypothetical protein